MAKERLTRLGLLLGIVILLFWGIKGVNRWRESRKVSGEAIQNFPSQLTEKIEGIGVKVLGRAVEVLPGSEKIKKDLGLKEEENDIFLRSEATETAKILEIHTREIIEILKQLPQEQLKEIRKQVLKEFCQQIIEE